MVQYLINVSVIWGVCLLTYELLLKRETYHQWNRFYLLLSVTAGLLIPLVPHQERALQTISRPVQHQVHQLIAMKQSIATVPAVTQPAVSGIQTATVNWILVLYLAGAAIAAFLFLKEIAGIIINYRRGIKMKSGRYQVIRVAKEISPYSFFNFIFIGCNHQYTENELAMLLQHERRHGSLLHSLDLLFISLLQVVCWFHPFVYLFKKRLQLVHEYQADEVARSNYTAYGTFLLEQNMLQASAPSIAHSFHSPIKNRIVMLTKNASAKRQLARYLVAVPLTLLFLVVCTHVDFAQSVQQQKNRNTMHLLNGYMSANGHTFQMDKQSVLHYEYVDERTGLTLNSQMELTPALIKMDGEPIYSYAAHSPSGFTVPSAIATYMVSANQSMFKHVEDGSYELRMRNVIIDKNGKVVYHDNVELVADYDKLEFKKGAGGKLVQVSTYKPGTKRADQKMLQLLGEQMGRTLDTHPAVRPATLKDQPVVSSADIPPAKIIVENHRARLVPGEGC